MKPEISRRNIRLSPCSKKVWSLAFILVYLGVTLTASGHSDHAHVHSHLTIQDRILEYFHPHHQKSSDIPIPVGSKNAGYFEFCTWDAWKATSLTTEVHEAFAVPGFLGPQTSPDFRENEYFPLFVPSIHQIRAPPVPSLSFFPA
jgi:hypothetical protein